MTTPNGSSDNNGQSQSWAGQPGYPAYPQYPGNAPQQSPSQDTFWSALFDFSFTRYATPSIIKVAYILGFAFIALVWVVYVLFAVIGLTSEIGAGGLILGLVVAVLTTVGAVFTLMTMRMMLEFYLSNIRIAQSVQNIDQRHAYRS